MTCSNNQKKTQGRIAAIVLNSVSHDARVLKEADSLSRAGFDMHIVGIQDNRCRDSVTHRESGVTIHRLPLGRLVYIFRYRDKARVCVAGLFVVSVVALILYTTTPENIFMEVGQKIVSAVGWSGILVGAPLTLIAALLIKRYYYFRILFAKQAKSVLSNNDNNYKLVARAVSFDLVRKSTLKAVVHFVKLVLATLRGLCKKIIPGKLVKLLRGFRGIKKWKKLKFSSKIYQLKLDELMPEAVHCHDLPMLPTGAEWCDNNPSAKLVFDSHELYEEISNISKLERYFCQKTLRGIVEKIDCFITINDSIAMEYNNRYPKLVAATIIKNASIFSNSVFMKNKGEENLLRAEAGVNPECKILLYQGGFAKHRGLELLVQAAERMPDDWVLVMMGWGNIETNLKSIAHTYDPTEHKIKFIPPAPQETLARWTSGATLGIIPYENTCLNHWYCTPNKLWEYPIAGVPMLVSPFPELKRVVTEFGVGACLPNKLDGESLHDILASISENGTLEAMKDACANFVKVDNWSVYAERLCDLYSRLLEDTKPSNSISLQ